MRTFYLVRWIARPHTTEALRPRVILVAAEGRLDCREHRFSLLVRIDLEPLEALRAGLHVGEKARRVFVEVQKARRLAVEGAALPLPELRMRPNAFEEVIDGGQGGRRGVSHSGTESNEQRAGRAQ